jgi:hypothetical protein
MPYSKREGVALPLDERDASLRDLRASFLPLARLLCIGEICQILCANSKRTS